MKLRLIGPQKSYLAAAILLVGVLTSYLIPTAQRVSVVASSYPVQACPHFASAGDTTASLPATKLGIRYLDGKSATFARTSRSQITLTKSSLLVDSNPGTSLVFSSLNSAGTAATACTAGNPDEWFIGGSGGLTSKGQLEIVNSGLSESIVDIFPFTSKSPLAQVTVKVKAKSSAAISLDVLAPGEDSMALHVLTRTGRVSAFLLDQRAKGLSNLGMDYVKPSDSPQKSLVIAGIYPHTGSKSGIVNSLRLLAPGSLDATVHVQVISGDGIFVPVGFDALQVKHGSVVTIPLANLTTSSAFGLQIESDQPILAGALTTNGSRDFAWAQPVRPLTATSMDFSGHIPVVTILGRSISVRLRGRYVTGKNFAVTIKGSDIATWVPKYGVASIKFTTDPKTPVFAGALFTSGGLTQIGIAQGAAIENTTVPFNDVHTLTH